MAAKYRGLVVPPTGALWAAHFTRLDDSRRGSDVELIRVPIVHASHCNPMAPWRDWISPTATVVTQFSCGRSDRRWALGNTLRPMASDAPPPSSVVEGWNGARCHAARQRTKLGAVWSPAAGVVALELAVSARCGCHRRIATATSPRRHRPQSRQRQQRRERDADRNLHRAPWSLVLVLGIA
jgi:hypothetical protein